MKLLVGLIMMLTATFAFADNPEFLYQADKGDHSVNLSYGYRSYGIDFEGSSGASGDDWEWNWEYHIIGLKYEWGINENFSIGAGLDYISGNLEFTLPGAPVPQRDWNISGIESIDLNFKGNHDFNFFQLHYGLIADISLETQQYEEIHYGRGGALHQGRVNASKGRHEFTPFVAANMKSENSNYGIKLAYQINTDTTHEFEDRNGAETETVHEGGSGLFLSLYYERALADKSMFGLALNYLTYEDLEVTESATATDVGEERKDYEYTTDGFRFDFYGKVNTGLMDLEFLPKFSYFLSSDNDYDEVNGNPDRKNDKITSTGGSYLIEFNLRKEF